MKKTLRCWQRNPSSFEDIFQLITQSFSILQKDKSHYYIKKKKIVLKLVCLIKSKYKNSCVNTNCKSYD